MKAQFVVSTGWLHDSPAWVSLVAHREGNDEWAFDDGSGLLRGDLNLWIDGRLPAVQELTAGTVVTVDIEIVPPAPPSTVPAPPAEPVPEAAPVEEVTPSPSTPSDAPPAEPTPTPSPDNPDPAPDAADTSAGTGDPSSSAEAGPSTTTTDSASTSPPADSSSTA